MVKTYSYHVYQPKANSKHGRFVDLDSNTGKGDALSGGNNKQLKRSKDGNTKRIVGTGPGGQLGDGTDSQAAELHLHAGPTDQLFAATHKVRTHAYTACCRVQTPTLLVFVHAFASPRCVHASANVPSGFFRFVLRPLVVFLVNTRWNS